MYIRYKESIRKILELANGRKLIFYGLDVLTKYVYQDLCELGKDILYFICENQENTCYLEKEIKNKYELLYENKEDIFIVGFVMNNHKAIYDSLIELGFELEKDFLLVGVGGYSQKFDAIDSLLGYNRYYEDILGFEIYGNLTESSYRILVLGGSTTDSTLGGVSKCWAYLLYEKLSSYYKDIVVLNGGMAGYTTEQEYQKLVRDGMQFNPHMVISFDGFNDVNGWNKDLEYPHLLKYQKKVYDYIEKKGDFAPDTLDLRKAKKIVHGIKGNKKEDFEQWFDNIRKMKAICSEFGVIYLSFLQPLIQVGNPIVLEEHRQLLKEIGKQMPGFEDMLNRTKKFYFELQLLIKDTTYIYDLTSIFDGKEDVYYDHCHSTQYGHEIISENIFPIIKQKIDESSK